jgi:Type VI secretion system/phage-baseplate injector OB domain
VSEWQGEQKGWSVSRFYGKYEGVVTDVSDPKKIGRLRAKVPAVLGENLDSGWAMPCVPAGGGKERGMLFLPQVGDTVWIEFAGGDVSRPIWVGTFWGAPDSTSGADDLGTDTGAETPTGDGGKEASETLSVLKTKSGHELTLDDDGEVILVANGNGKSSIRFEQDGTVTITADKIKLGSSASEKVVLGDTFMQFFNAHVHPTGVGPSGPPTQPMSTSQLSQKVTTE